MYFSVSERLTVEYVDIFWSEFCFLYKGFFVQKSKSKVKLPKTLQFLLKLNIPHTAFNFAKFANLMRKFYEKRQRMKNSVFGLFSPELILSFKTLFSLYYCDLFYIRSNIRQKVRQLYFSHFQLHNVSRQYLYKKHPI